MRSSVCISVSSGGALKDVYSKKAELATHPDEKKEMLFRPREVYDRELKDATRAIETYQSILDLDQKDVTAIQATRSPVPADVRWYDLLQILEREVELSSSTGPRTVSPAVSDGPAVGKELKDLARAWKPTAMCWIRVPHRAPALTRLPPARQILQLLLPSRPIRILSETVSPSTTKLEPRAPNL